MSSTASATLLNASAMGTPEALAEAFSAIAAQHASECFISSDASPSDPIPLSQDFAEAARSLGQRKVIRGELREGLLGELATLGAHLKRIDFDRGIQLQKLSQNYGLASNREYHQQASVQIDNLLRTLPPPLLVELRSAIGVAAVEGSDTLFAPAIVPARDPMLEGLKIFVEGQAFQPAAGAGNLFPRVTDPSKREAVSNAGEERERAEANLAQAIERYLRGLYLPDHMNHLSKHLQALMSGEIGAPESLRQEVVAFVGSGVGHAAAYAEALLSDAILAGQLTQDLLTLIPSLSGLEPKKLPTLVRPPLEEIPPSQPELGRAAPALGTMKELADQLEVLWKDHAEEMSALAAIHPAAFGKDAMRRMMILPQISEELAKLTDPRERAEYIAVAESFGCLPEGYLSRATDPRKVTITMPARSPRPVPAAWEDPITAYMATDEFAMAVAAIPQAIASYGLEARLRSMIQEKDGSRRLGTKYHASAVQILYSMNKNPEDGRRAYMRLRLHMLRSTVQRLQESGILGMKGLDERVKHLISQGLLSEAEAVIDFATVWMNEMEGLIQRRDDTKIDLRLIGESAAERRFDAISDDLLAHGDIEGLRALITEVRGQTRGGALRLKAHIAELTKRSLGTLTTVIESARVLAMIPDAAARNTLAVQVPSVDRLLSEGPMGETHARELLRKRGFQLPGDPGVPALGTPTSRGYLPAPEGEKRPLLGSGEVAKTGT